MTMTNDEWQKILAKDASYAARLAYADWLEENDESSPDGLDAECYRLQAVALELNRLADMARPIVRDRFNLGADIYDGCLACPRHDRRDMRPLIRAALTSAKAHLPKVLRERLLAAAAAGKSADVNMPNFDGDDAGTARSWQVCAFNSVGEACILAAKDEIASLIAADDAAHLARYEAFRAAVERGETPMPAAEPALTN